MMQTTVVTSFRCDPFPSHDHHILVPLFQHSPPPLSDLPLFLLPLLHPPPVPSLPPASHPQLFSKSPEFPRARTAVPAPHTPSPTPTHHSPSAPPHSAPH